MTCTLNLCTSVLPKFSYNDAVKIAAASGYKGIELRVDDRYHKSLEELSNGGIFLRRQLNQLGLQVPVLNTYIPVNDEAAVDKLLYCCQQANVSAARLVLPRSCRAAVAKRAATKEIIPSYESAQEPEALLLGLKNILERLEYKAYKAGVKLLLELHWGTVMSSFTSAYWLTHGLDPNHIGITFDPANMMVEGKEDWEFGLKLVTPYLANVHVKNMIWKFDHLGGTWQWTPLSRGMVDWPELIGLLTECGYSGDYAVEDFLAPSQTSQAAIQYLSWVRSEFEEMYEHFGYLPVTHPLLPAAFDKAA